MNVGNTSLTAVYQHPNQTLWLQIQVFVCITTILKRCSRLVDAQVKHGAKCSVGDDCQKKISLYLVGNTYSLSLTAKHRAFLPVSALLTMRI